VQCSEDSPISSAKIDDRFVYQHRSSQVRPRERESGREGEGTRKREGDRDRKEEIEIEQREVR
jgi:hypothetical protein